MLPNRTTYSCLWECVDWLQQVILTVWWEHSTTVIGATPFFWYLSCYWPRGLWLWTTVRTARRKFLEAIDKVDPWELLLSWDSVVSQIWDFFGQRISPIWHVANERLSPGSLTLWLRYQRFLTNLKKFSILQLWNIIDFCLLFKI